MEEKLMEKNKTKSYLKLRSDPWSLTGAHVQKLEYHGTTASKC